MKVLNGSKKFSNLKPYTMSKIIRIGTRDSELALWQANTVSQKINDLGYKTEIVPVKSDGDIILDKPLYELGITGIFTKTLDVAMISGKLDIAVLSMQDVPTALPQGIIQAAVLKRANVLDLLVHKGSTDFLNGTRTTATGSHRRNAQWSNKYPSQQVEDLRGNINYLLQKFIDNNWNGAIFAAAGLERLSLSPALSKGEGAKTLLVKRDALEFVAEVLDWMIPAPAQGAMLVVAMENDNFVLDAVAQLNDIESEITTHIERQFLRTLEGGCTAPIGAIAKYNEHDDTLHFKGVLLSIDGKQKFEIEKNVPINEWKKLGFYAAKEILENGGEQLMKELREQLKK